MFMRARQTNFRNAMGVILPICLCLWLCAALPGCDRGDSTRPGKEAASDLALAFPEGFLWGVAGSAYQTEGGNVWSDYDRWIEDGHGTEPCGEADRSYELYELDAQLAASLGSNAYRMGIEWARIEPERDRINKAEVEHYRMVLQAVVDRGMRPVVTLHHFTNPIWIQQQGGWLNPDTVEQFVQYAELAAVEYGDLADLWLTINEPVIYTVGTYMINAYPGGRLSCFEKAVEATINMIFAHAGAYGAIKTLDAADADGDGQSALISAARALYPVEPLDPQNPDDAQSALMFDYFMCRHFFRAAVEGALDVNIDGDADDGYTDPPEGYYESLAGTMDFLAVNYYSPLRVKHFPALFGPIQGVPCYPQADFICYPGGREPYIQGDNGNEVYPDGLFELIADYQLDYGLPVFVTENGIASTDGYLRSWFIIEHLKSVHAAMESGLEVMGYLYWSLLDNFEWLLGYSMRFGLFTVDYSDFRRIPTEGGETFSQIAHAGGVSYDLLDRYSEPPEPR